MGVADNVAGNQWRLTILDNALHRPGGCFLNGGVDIRAGRLFFQSADQIHDRPVRHRNPHGQSIQFALQLRQDFADSLGGSSGCGDDVFTGRPAATKILVRHVCQALIIGVGMHRGNKTFFEAEGIVYDFGNGCQAIGGAGRVGDDPVLRLELLVVDPDHDGRIDFFFGRNRQNHLARPGGQMFFQWFAVAENTGGFDHNLNPQFLPGDLSRIAMFGHHDPLIAHRHGIFFGGDLLVKDAHHRIIFQKISQLLIVKQIVDRDNFHVFAVTDNAKYTSADAAESIYADFYNHYAASLSISTNFRIKSTTRWV